MEVLIGFLGFLLALFQIERAVCQFPYNWPSMQPVQQPMPPMQNDWLQQTGFGYNQQAPSHENRNNHYNPVSGVPSHFPITHGNSHQFGSPDGNHFGGRYPFYGDWNQANPSNPTAYTYNPQKFVNAQEHSRPQSNIVTSPAVSETTTHSTTSPTTNINRGQISDKS